MSAPLASFGPESSTAPDRLIVSSKDIKSRQIVVVSGAGVLVRGTVVGQITTGGKYQTAVAAAEDGSEDVDLILAHDVDATSADVTTVAYERGDFDENELTFGAGHTADSTREAFRLKGIVLHSSITP